MLKIIKSYKNLSEWFNDLSLEDKLDLHNYHENKDVFYKIFQNNFEIDSQVGGVDDIKGK